MPKPIMPVLGAQMYTCRDFCKDIKGVAESLQRVRAIGYTTCQASGFGKDVMAKDIAKAADDAGITISATHCAWPRFTGELDLLIDEHKTMRCPHAAIGSLPNEYKTWDGIKKFVEELESIAGRLAREGIDFSFHNHDQEFVKRDGQTWLEALYATADPEILKAELDVHWVARGGGDPVKWIRSYPGRQPLLHLKDLAVHLEDGKAQPRFAEIGEGNLNWPGILAAAMEAGVQCAYVEQDDCYGKDPFDSLAISYRNCQAMGLR